MTPQLIEHVTERLNQIESRKLELKEHRDVIEEAADRDKEYQRLLGIAREATRNARLQREAILNEPEYRQVTADLQQVRRDIKEIKAVLSGELLAIVKDEDTLQFTDADGNMRQITISATAKKTNQLSMV